MNPMCSQSQRLIAGTVVAYCIFLNASRSISMNRVTLTCLIVLAASHALIGIVCSITRRISLKTGGSVLVSVSLFVGKYLRNPDGFISPPDMYHGSPSDQLFVLLFIMAVFTAAGMIVSAVAGFFTMEAISSIKDGTVRKISNRRKRGVCVYCEYDLTGNVSGICPECGNPIGSSPCI